MLVHAQEKQGSIAMTAGIHTPSVQCILGYMPLPPAATAVDRTHHGMHSCFVSHLVAKMINSSISGE